MTPGRKLWEDEQGGQRKDLSRDLKDEEELVRGTAWKTASSWRQNNRGLKVWRVSRGGERVRSEFLEEGVGDGWVLWDPHVSLVGKGCRQPWGHQEGMWWASSVCLHFPSDTPMPVSPHICPHLYLNSCPCHSVSISPVSSGGQPWATSLWGLWAGPEQVRGGAAEELSGRWRSEGKREWSV